jgi:hypothetical protein
MNSEIKMVSYYNDKLHLSILAPETWQVQQVNEHMFRLLGEVEKVHEDFFEEYKVNMSFELRKGTISDEQWFKDFVKKNNESMQSSYEQYELIEEEYFSLDINNAYRKVYTWVEPETKFKLYQQQALLTNSIDTLYVINASVLLGLEKKYMPIFTEILKSTRIIPPKKS